MVDQNQTNRLNIQRPIQNRMPVPPRPILPPKKPITPPQPQINNNGYSAGKNIQFLEPEITEKKNWEMKNAGFAIILGFVLVLIQFIAMTLLNLEPTGSWILAFILIVIFGVVVYFLMEPTTEKEIRQKIIETNLQTVEKPVIKEVIKTVEVNKPVYTEVPVVKEVPVYREPKTVYIAKSETNRVVTRRAPQIKYGFVGSKLQKVYHKNTCRLSKSIEKKYLVKSPTIGMFKRLKYKPCKVCKPKQ